MDTKWKRFEEGQKDESVLSAKVRKTNPFKAWLCFALGVSVIGVCVIGAFVGLSQVNWDWKELKAVFFDYRHSIPFRQRTAEYFYALLSLVTDQADAPGDNHISDVSDYRLTREGENLKYYAVNLDSGVAVSNMAKDILQDFGEVLVEPDGIANNLPLPDGYGYYWYFDGSRVYVVEDGELVDIERLDSGYRNLLPDVAGYVGGEEAAKSIRAVLAVCDVLIPNPYDRSMYDQEQQIFRFIALAYLVVLMVGVGLLGYSMLRREAKREFEAQLASWLGSLWLEAKVVITFMLSIPFLVTGMTIYPVRSGLGDALAFGVLILVMFWWIYVVVLDISRNGTQVFTNNCITHISQWYRDYETRYPWQKVMIRRMYTLIGAEICLAVLAVLSLVMFFPGGYTLLGLVLFVVFVGFGLHLIHRYTKSFSNTVSEIGLLMDHIERMKRGDLGTELTVNPDSAVYHAVHNLNDIQEGVNLAVSEKLKSERLKVDLITNVSHDLKTPLTSIASYVDLLAKEDLPEHVKDYVSVLTQKTEQLKNLIQDLFDLSKATSNNLSLDLKEIDLRRLIEQTLGDMEESIENSGIPFKVDLPDEPVLIVNDGTKLSRVLQNLFSNALKYSLSGTRVYVSLKASENEAVVTIKNTANYEMDFDPDEILQRFARGDTSRTTEGSGLGLSIAKSYTEACGGKFAISIDGDQFTAEVILPQV